MIDWFRPLETIEDTPQRVEVLPHGRRETTRRVFPENKRYSLDDNGNVDQEDLGWWLVGDDGVSFSHEWPSVRNVEIKQYSDAEKLAMLRDFLVRANGFGFMELSRDKIEGEYRYIHRRARQLLGELFPPEPSKPSVADEDF